MKITKSQVQVLHAPADEQLVDVQPKSGGMRAFVTIKMMTDEGIYLPFGRACSTHSSMVGIMFCQTLAAARKASSPVSVSQHTRR